MRLALGEERLINPNGPRFLEGLRQLIEGYGRHDWTRTSDLYRVKGHLSSPLNNLSRRWGPPKPLQIRARRRFNGLENGLENALVGKPGDRVSGITSALPVIQESGPAVENSTSECHVPLEAIS